MGNIGGILARTKQVSGQADRHSFYSYDGSGNVVSVTDSSQNVQCAYAYSGFGLEKTQEAAGWGQPYRYSTKWQHPNSGLVEYGFRFYNPGWGRWINRDPIGEAGGSNLYAMVGNDPINVIDDYGLFVPAAAPIVATPVGAGVALSIVVTYGIYRASDALALQYYQQKDNGLPAPTKLPPKRGKKSDPTICPQTNPGRGKDGNCKPCDDDPEPWEGEGNDHGSTTGTHWHWIEYHQRPSDCECIPIRRSGPTKPIKIGNTWRAG